MRRLAALIVLIFALVSPLVAVDDGAVVRVHSGLIRGRIEATSRVFLVLVLANTSSSLYIHNIFIQEIM